MDQDINVVKDRDDFGFKYAHNIYHPDMCIIF